MGVSERRFAWRKRSEEKQQQSTPEEEKINTTTADYESVYQFYTDNVFPAIMGSLPILLRRLADDSKEMVATCTSKFLHFLAPKWSESHTELPTLRQLWDEAQHSSVSEFMLRHFDTNQDGHITSEEFLNMTDMMRRMPRPNPETFWTWFSREWPLMDWKIGLFLWKTFGGILLFVAVLSIIPGRMHAISAKILRWPVLGITYLLIAVELVVYVAIRLGIIVAEALVAKPKHRKLRRLIQNAKSYDEWYKYAHALDKSQKRDRWLKSVKDHTSYRYNWAFIKELMRDMRHARAKGDSLLALAVIQQCTRKNVGGIMSPDLFCYSNAGEPKAIVKEFVGEVVKTLNWLTDEALKLSDPQESSSATDKEVYEKNMQQQVRVEKDKLWKSLVDIVDRGGSNDSKHDKDTLSTTSSSDQSEGEMKRNLPSCHRDEVLAFLKRARAAYGRTALCLSGGAMMGLYHVGHIRGLLEVGGLPDIISGTSAGSVIAAVVCTRTDEELERDLDPDLLADHMRCFERPWSERIKSVWKNGHMFDFEEWMDMIKWFTCGDMTFEEAYKKTGRVFCITLSATTKKAPPVLLNHLSAPNVTIASAVVASAAVPGCVPPVRLMYKDSNGQIKNQGTAKDQTYYDGSIRQDIPVNGLAEMLNCQFFIACQCNPHIVPFFYSPKGAVGRPSRWSSGHQEDSWRGGFLLAALEMYLKNDMKAKNVFLNDLEAAVGFTSTMMTQEYEGSITIVPQVSIWDFTRLFSDPKREEMDHYFQGGAVAVYEHTALIKLHYSIADALDDCLARLETGTRGRTAVKRRSTFAAVEPKFASAPFENSGVDNVPVNPMDGALRVRNESDGGPLSSGTPDTEDYEDEDEFERWIDLQ